MTSGRVPTALRSRSFRSDRLAWAALLVAIPVTIAATTAWLHRPVPLHAPAAALVADFRLPVLAYGRVAPGAGDRHLAVGALAEHLEALRAAGFHPVTLGQVHAAYRDGAPLPARAILLTFDGGHLSTYQAVDPLLRRLGWPAVMFLDPRLPEGRHSTYAYWDRLQRMVDSGLWDLGATTRWSEAAPVFERRLEHHRVLAALSEGAAGPGGDDEAPALRFEDGLFGVNDPSADPRRLVRLRVPRDWSGRELVDRLELSLAAPALAASGAPVGVPAARWVRGAGRIDAAGDLVVLRGEPRAEAWVAGGEWARDFVLEADVLATRGAFWVVHQEVGSREQWRWGATDRRRYLQRLSRNGAVQVISSTDARDDRSEWHSLRLIKRGEGIWVEWDGVRVGDLPRGVAARWRGHVGIATGTPGEAGEVAFRNVRFAAIPYELRAVGASPSDEEIRSLLAQADRLAAISPPGLVQSGPEFVRSEGDRRLLTMLAARGAWDVVPAVRLADAAPGDDVARAERVAEIAAREGWAGVRVVGAGAGSAASFAGAPAWERVFARRGLRLAFDGSEDQRAMR